MHIYLFQKTVIKNTEFSVDQRVGQVEKAEK